MIKILGEKKHEPKLIPMGNHVVVRHIEEKVSAGGIELPEGQHEILPRGEVLAVGPGSRTLSGECVPIPLEVGDVVRFKNWVMTKHNGEICLVEADGILAREARQGE